VLDVIFIYYCDVVPMITYCDCQVRVYYTGRLANGKIFDSTTTGNGFKFKLGKKQVISGWDVGLSGKFLFINIMLM